MFGSQYAIILYTTAKGFEPDSTSVKDEKEQGSSSPFLQLWGKSKEKGNERCRDAGLGVKREALGRFLRKDA